MLAFASKRSTPFIEIEDKGGEIVQRYKSFRKDWTWTWTKREQN
jgi:hypothetical protein